jgi:hypothetical protein
MSATATAPAPTLTTQEKVLEHIGYSAAAMEKAAAFHAHVAQQQTKVAALIPACVKAMVDNERVKPDEAEKLAKVLQDPVAVIALLTETAGHRNPSEAIALGRGVGQKQANAANRNVVVGGRRDSDSLAESDRRLLAGLGLPIPNE